MRSRRREETVSELLELRDALLEEHRRTFAEIQAMRGELAQLRTDLDATNHVVREALEVLVDDEARARERLVALRESETYRVAWTDPEPLVTIVIPTYVHWELLESRALPSALAQTHPNIEVVVVGDAAGDEIGAAIERVGDPRVRYENLTVRGPYPEDERRRWYVAGTGPMNRALELARGRWVAFLNDDDALRPEHVEVLLAEARRTGAEITYGKLAEHGPEGERGEIGSFPPADHAFGWQLALQHAGLRLFEFQLAAHLFDQPGDWHRARRMMRAGVRFAQVDRVTCDYYPSFLWREGQAPG
jgi:hypothetical protein